MAILSNFGKDDSDPFTVLDRALDEMENMGWLSSAEGVAAVVTRRPGAEEFMWRPETEDTLCASGHNLLHPGGEGGYGPASQGQERRHVETSWHPTSCTTKTAGIREITRCSAILVGDIHLA